MSFARALLPPIVVVCLFGMVLAMATAAAQAPATVPEQSTPPAAPQQAKPEQQTPAEQQQAKPEQTTPQQETSEPKPEAAPKPGAAPKPAPPTARAKAPSVLTPKETAWKMLEAGIAEQSKEKRATAVRVLGLVNRDRRAEQLAEHALGDKEPEVRAAAASALGQMGAKGSIPKLRRAVRDKEPEVVFAAASSLRMLGDREAYRVYYAVLTGKLKSGKGLIEEQKEMIKDPKKVALFGFEQGIGFVPFAGLGYQAFKILKKDDSSPVRAAAAKVLAKDPDPLSAQALVEAATTDESWLVRTAALDAIAHRGDPSLVAKIVPALADDKEEVRFTAAAAILRLERGGARKKAAHSPTAPGARQ